MQYTLTISYTIHEDYNGKQYRRNISLDDTNIDSVVARDEAYITLPDKRMPLKALVMIRNHVRNGDSLSIWVTLEKEVVETQFVPYIFPDTD